MEYGIITDANAAAGDQEQQQPPPPAYTEDPKIAPESPHELGLPPVRELDSIEGMWSPVSPRPEKVQPMVELPGHAWATAADELPVDRR